MSLFRREHRQWTPEPFIPPFPGMSTPGGGAPTTHAALRSSAVWACVRLLADTVSMMPLHAYTLKDGARVPTPDPPLLVKPSEDASMQDWIYMAMVSLLLRGNAYGHIVRRDSMQYPVQIEILDPDQVRVTRENGHLVYRTRDGGVIPTLDMLHIRAYRMPGLAVGLSPIQYAATQINTDAAIATFALGYFIDAPHPTSVLTSDQSINQEQARTIKERLKDSVKGREPLVLGAGLKFSNLSVSPEESQFLATQKLGDVGIARIFGVPPNMVGMPSGDSMTYSNDNQRVVDYLTFSVQAWLTRFESAFYPLMPGNKHVRFDTSVLTRTDIETRVKAGAIGIASKQFDPDEVRAWSDYAPLTDKQREWLEIIPLTVRPTGTPVAAPNDPVSEAPPTAAPAAKTKGEPA